MKIKEVPFSWIPRWGHRLDVEPFVGGAVETRVYLEKAPYPKQALHELTTGHNGGIYNGPMFRRNYVDSRMHGVPFLTSGSMLRADLSDVGLLRRKDAESPKLCYLRLTRGTTLISCSGSIGRTVYARPDMEGMWASQDIMKVVPNPATVPPGFLFAYLSSKFGVPMVTSGTYGAIIQHIEPEHIATLPVPRLGNAVETEIHDLVEEAAMLRAGAAKAIRETVAAIPATLGLRPLKIDDVTKFGVAEVFATQLKGRLDAAYHSAAAMEVDSQFASCGVPVAPMTEVLANYFKPPMFKRLWVNDPEYGRQFVSGNDAYRFEAEELRYVSIKTPNFEEFILKRGWIVFQAAGQIYGLFAQPLFVNGWLEDIFCADDMYRLVPHNEIDGAYLFAFLKTPYGQVLLKRQASGNSIPRVWDPHVRDIRIPWPSEMVREDAALPILRAHADIEAARVKEKKAIALVEMSIEGAA